MKDSDNLHRILYEGQPTHEAGFASNPSKLLHPSKDLQGNPRQQNFVPSPPSSTTFVDENGFDPKPIPGSSHVVLAEDVVESNLAKHSLQSEDT